MSVWSFIHNESGAATVDWVVATCAMVGLGLAVQEVVNFGLFDLTRDVRTEFQDGLFETAWDAHLAVTPVPYPTDP